MPGEELSAKELREAYKKGSLKQRHSVARQRMENPEHGPNIVVNSFAAFEGYARAVAVKVLVESGTTPNAAYDFHRNHDATELIEKHICPAFRTSPAKLFGSAWNDIPDAVSYRNVLVHDATYLNNATCKRLISSLRHCFDRLAALTLK